MKSGTFALIIFFSITILSTVAFPQIISKIGYKQTGNASYYPDNRNGAVTRSGEKYNMYALEGAHRYIAFNSLVKITNLENDKVAYVRINDRPYTNNRIIDLTLASAKQLGMVGKTTTKVSIEVVANNAFRKNKYSTSRQTFLTPNPNNKTTSYPVSKPVSIDLPSAKLEKIFTPVNTYTLMGQTAYPKGYGIQIGSYKEVKTAMEKANRLETLQFKNVFIQAGWAQKNKIYRVILGNFLKKEDAKLIESYLKNHYEGIYVKAHLSK